MSSKLRHFDWVALLAMFGLIALGTVAIWSAGTARSALFHTAWKDHLLTAAFGLVPYLVLAFTDYRRWLDLAAVPTYAGALVCLVLVLVVGDEVLGARRWLWFFQPSEVSKLAILLLVASVFGQHGAWGLGSLRGFGGFVLAATLVLVPCGLILAEPDLGTTLTLIPAVALMLLVADVWRRGLVVIASVAGMAALVMLCAVYEAEKPGVLPEKRERILRYVPLQPHQVKRVRTFLFPETNRDGAGWNLRQAKIAIGSGGFAGKGLGQGEQSHLKYLPPAGVMNDFIFCVWAEETGYRGTLLLLSVFALLFYRVCRAACRADDFRGRLFALGLLALLFAHVYVNIGMSIGLVPITGLPLPFISSGRTFLVTVMCGLGIVQSVIIHGKEKKK